MSTLNPSVEKRRLKLHRGALTDPKAQAAYRRLMHAVLGLTADAVTFGAPWTPFALFEPGGRCVGNVEAAVLPLVSDGVGTQASGLRSVAVDPDWRGQGLFRDLMGEALAWCEAQFAVPTFLYTEDAALYERFGFRAVPQHAVVGPAPEPSAGPQARRLDPGQGTDRAIIGRLVARRTAVSSRFALGVDAAQFLTNVAKDESLTVAYLAESETLMVYEEDEERIVIVDIVAPAMPDLATVLGALGRRPTQVKVLFPTDKIGWDGTAQREDTGLMVRGAAPSETTPFMIPPTAEF